MRLFIALNIPAEERERIAAAIRCLRESGLPVRWLTPDAYHLTLKFLGEVREDTAGDLIALLRQVAARHGPLLLRLRRAGAFPNQRQPTVWWLGIEPSNPLAALQQDVEQAVAAVGFPPEQRPFSPHLTMGRTARGAAPAALAGAAPLLQSVQHDRTITVETLDLMRSHLSPRGARYECVCAAEFRP